MRKLVIILFLLVGLYKADAQKYGEGPFDLRDSYGIFGNFGLNQHNANFKGLPGIGSCCPGYEFGRGAEYSLGLFFELPVARHFTLAMRGAYTNLSGLLSKIEPAAVYDPVSNTSVNGEFRHSVDASLASISLMPLLSYRVTDRIDLHIGFRGGYMMTKKAIQKEEITKPSWGLFKEENSRVRNTYDGEIKDASALDLALAGGVGFYLPLNKSRTLFLVPEAFITYGVLPIVSGLSWNVVSLSAGFSLTYAPRLIIPDIPPPPPPMPNLPAPPDVPVLAADIKAVAVDDKGNESDITTIRIEELQSTQTFPMLNYVFFDDNSPALPDRYAKLSDEDIQKFDGKHFKSQNNLDVYYNMLNIIGLRLRNNPDENITITGYNSGIGSEKGNLKLSQERADNIKKYLVNYWKIEPGRLKTAAGNMPPVPSSSTELAGQEENRRVEITTNNKEMLAPVIVRDTVRKYTCPKIVFKSSVNSGIGIDQWHLSCTQNNVEIKRYEGTGQPQTIEWEISRGEAGLNYRQPVNYQMTIVDKDNKKWISDEKKMPLVEEKLELEKKQVVSNTEIDKFTLTLFDFDRADLDARNMRTIEAAKKRIRKNSIITIKGYTDNLGEAEHNRLLSQRRANASAKALGVDFKLAEGLGKSVLLYENKYPEERFYSRSVIITIETPVTNEKQAEK